MKPLAILIALAVSLPFAATAKPSETRTSGAALTDYDGKGGTVAPRPTKDIIWVDIKGF